MDDKTLNDFMFSVGGYIAGKTADGLIGNDLAAWTEMLKNTASERLANIENIIRFRSRKADVQGKPLSNLIPARLTERILNEGSYCSQYIMQEYYAGVLLSAQEDKINDDGILYLSTIHRLTSTQLKAHYVFYQMLKEALNGRVTAKNAWMILNPISLSTHHFMSVNADFLLTTLFGENFSEEPPLSLKDEVSRYERKMQSVIGTLRKEELLGSFRATYDLSVFGEYFSSNDNPIDQSLRKHFYYTFRASSFGIMLYMWGQGYGLENRDQYLEEGVVCPRLTGIDLDMFHYHELDSENNPFKSHLEVSGDGRAFSFLNTL